MGKSVRSVCSLKDMIRKWKQTFRRNLSALRCRRKLLNVVERERNGIGTYS